MKEMLSTRFSSPLVGSLAPPFFLGFWSIYCAYNYDFFDKIHIFSYFAVVPPFQIYIYTFFEGFLFLALVDRFGVHGATMRRLIIVGKLKCLIMYVRAISKLFRFISITSSDKGDNF